MKRKLGYVGILVLAIASIAEAQGSGKLSADTVLRKTLTKLLAIKTIKYKYHQEYDYASEGYKAESKADTFLEFTPLDNVIGLKFQFRNDDRFIAYNGSEVFELKEKDKTIKVESNPNVQDLSYRTHMSYGPLMLRNALPTIIADKSVVKSVTETRTSSGRFYVIEFVLDKKYIDSGIGNILPMTIDRKTVYRVTVDKTSFMPVEVFRGNNVNKDFNRTTYSDIAENPTPPVETSWFYSTYLDTYQHAKPPENKLIKKGEVAADWTLPMYRTGGATSLNDFDGKVVLLDFWIFHCGACQDSVPRLNALQAKYKNKDFKLLTVNIADSPKLIDLFVKKAKPKFPILYNGKDLAEKYGVTAYPTAILIGKEGNVLYAGGFDAKVLDELIGKSL